MHPEQLAAFALIPLSHPLKAAEELTRCVSQVGFRGALINNHYRGESLDNPKFWPVFETAEKLDFPIYIHPALPIEHAVNARFTGNYPAAVSRTLAGNGWAWHADTGMAFLRLYLSGLFDAYPKVKVVLGHMGEMLPYQLDRIIQVFSRVAGTAGLKRQLRQVIDENLWITTSGMFSLHPMACLLNVIKRDRLMFSVDYPQSSNELGRKFIDDLEQSGMVTRSELEDIAYKNAARLLKLQTKLA